MESTDWSHVVQPTKKTNQAHTTHDYTAALPQSLPLFQGPEDVLLTPFAAQHCPSLGIRENLKQKYRDYLSIWQMALV